MFKSSVLVNGALHAWYSDTFVNSVLELVRSLRLGGLLVLDCTMLEDAVGTARSKELNDRSPSDI